MRDFLKDLESDKKKLMLALIFAAIFLYMDYSLVIKSQLGAMKKSGSKIKEVRANIESLSANVKRMQGLIEQEKSGKAIAGAKKVKSVIARESIMSLMQDITNAANKFNVRVSQMKSSPDLPATKQKGAPVSRFSSILITLELNCDYHNLGRFINELENGPALVSVQELKAKPEAQDSLKEAATLVLKAYVKN